MALSSCAALLVGYKILVGSCSRLVSRGHWNVPSSLPYFSSSPPPPPSPPQCLQTDVVMEAFSEVLTELNVTCPGKCRTACGIESWPGFGCLLASQLLVALLI